MKRSLTNWRPIVVVAMLGVGALVVLAPVVVIACFGLVLLAWMANSRPAWVVMGLLIWLPFEGWILKFIPGSSALLVVPDVVCLLLAFVLLGRLLLGKIAPAEKSHLRLLLGPPLMLALVGLASWGVNLIPAVDALYWFRVYLRFVPLALVLAGDDVRDIVSAKLPVIASFVIIVQSAIGIAQYVGGEGVARFFWPGQYALGAVASQVDTFATVGTRVVAGTLGHYNAYGMTLVLWVAVLLGVASDRWKVLSSTHQLMVLAAVSSGSILVILSQSRQSVAMLVVLFVVWLIRAGTLSTRFRAAVVAVGAITILYMTTDAAIGIDALISRLSSLGDAWYWTVDVAKNRGYVVTSVASAVLKRAPLIGVGPGSMGSSYGSLLGPVGVSVLGLNQASARFVGDVGWVSVLAQVGVFGVLSLVWLCRRVLQAMSRPGVLSHTILEGTGVLAVLIIGMSASSLLTYKGPSSVLWVLYGLVITSGASAMRGSLLVDNLTEDK
ncbi:MAG: hypothetical protein D9V44_02355 [Actinobacteria bacterium]|nr:MAG: hypothetical protein D9V44_02355 [Actinomycetota bacterium]